MTSRHDDVVLWRLKTLEDDDGCPEITPQFLADSLSCEGLPQEFIPKKMEKRVTAFRHLRQDERFSRCHSVLLELETYRRELESYAVKKDPMPPPNRHPFRRGYSHPAQAAGGGPYCQDCGFNARHPNHTTEDDMEKTTKQKLSQAEVRAILFEYPDADLSAFDIQGDVEATALEVTAKTLRKINKRLKRP